MADFKEGKLNDKFNEKSCKIWDYFLIESEKPYGLLEVLDMIITKEQIKSAPKIIKNGNIKEQIWAVLSLMPKAQAIQIIETAALSLLCLEVMKESWIIPLKQVDFCLN